MLFRLAIFAQHRRQNQWHSHDNTAAQNNFQLTGRGCFRFQKRRGSRTHIMFATQYGEESLTEEINLSGNGGQLRREGHAYIVRKGERKRKGEEDRGSVANGSGATYRTKIPAVLIFQWTVSPGGSSWMQVRRE